MAVMAVDVDAPVAVKERLEAFAGEVLAEAMNRPVQLGNGSLYLRGLLEQGPRKSLEPMVERLAGDADYQSLQQFVADSPWDPALVVKAVAERVAPEIDVEAWVLDDTGFPKDGKDSPGVKRQYSGTLGKTGNCQIGVSVHAVGACGTVPLGWTLYLPEDWCADEERRHKAKIPDEVAFKTKPQLGVELIERAAGWDVPKAPVLGDHAYGENTWLRDRLHQAGCEYVLSRGAARLLDLKSACRHPTRAARAAGKDALEDGARLQAAQGRARARPLRGALIPGLVPPHRSGHSRARIPHPGAPSPKSPTVGLTLPKTVQLLQPIFKCWTGRCQICSQPVELDQLPLNNPARQDE